MNFFLCNKNLPFSYRPFSLDNFDDYEKHFTVMNYVEGGKNLKQVHLCLFNIYTNKITIYNDIYINKNETLTFVTYDLYTEFGKQKERLQVKQDMIKEYK